jgi:hypothetical protein
MPWMPDLTVTILALAALAAVLGLVIWNLDRFRNHGSDPFVNPAWTILLRPSRRRLPQWRPKLGSIASNDTDQACGEDAIEIDPSPDSRE